MESLHFSHSLSISFAIASFFIHIRTYMYIYSGAIYNFTCKKFREIKLSFYFTKSHDKDDFFLYVARALDVKIQDFKILKFQIPKSWGARGKLLNFSISQKFHLPDFSTIFTQILNFAISNWEKSFCQFYISNFLTNHHCLLSVI